MRSTLCITVDISIK